MYVWSKILTYGLIIYVLITSIQTQIVKNVAVSFKISTSQ